MKTVCGRWLNWKSLNIPIFMWQELLTRLFLARVNMTRVAGRSVIRSLERSYSDLQIKSLLIFIVVAMVLLLAAAWAGMVLARQMTEPVDSLDWSSGTCAKW